jgi:hypothetical protein
MEGMRTPSCSGGEWQTKIGWRRLSLRGTRSFEVRVRMGGQEDSETKAVVMKDGKGEDEDEDRGKSEVEVINEVSRRWNSCLECGRARLVRHEVLGRRLRAGETGVQSAVARNTMSISTEKRFVRLPLMDGRLLGGACTRQTETRTCGTGELDFVWGEVRARSDLLLAVDEDDGGRGESREGEGNRLSRANGVPHSSCGCQLSSPSFHFGLSPLSPPKSKH